MPRKYTHPTDWLVNCGGTAFPVSYTAFPGGTGETASPPNHEKGMTLRDWFAGQAISGLLTSKELLSEDAEFVATMAYMLADAMLRAKRSAPDVPDEE